jgi:hypothetical protein
MIRFKFSDKKGFSENTSLAIANLAASGACADSFNASDTIRMACACACALATIAAASPSA